MNSFQAKQIHLPELMSSLGYQATQIKKEGREYWFASPFRDEEDPSFHTSFLGGKWIWNDFGDMGGTVIDFVMRHENFARVRDALQYLDQYASQNPGQTRLFEKTANLNHLTPKTTLEAYTASRKAQKVADTKPLLQFLKAQEIRNPIIYSYLEQERCIPRHLARKYLQEIHYRHTRTGRTFFAFGIQNRSRGYELRMASDQYAFAKSCLGKKDICIIPGLHPGKGKVNVFEGMLDFLSLMAMYDCSELNGDSIILNTARYVGRVVEFVRSQAYTGMNCFLDNDRAGEEGLADLKLAFGEEFVRAQNHLYEGSEDVNAGWVVVQ